MQRTVILLGFLGLMAISRIALCDDIESRILMLEENLKKQAETIREQQKIIDELKEQKQRADGTVEHTPSVESGAVPPEAMKTTQPTGLFGSANMMNPNISLILDAFGYASSLSNGELSKRAIPGFTTIPKDARNGFNLGAAGDGGELFIFSPVDPYFNVYANIPFSDNGVALEEIFAVTTSLPAGIQMKGGKFKSNFSRVDAQHPHAWDFFDIPLAYRAFVGGEGLGGEKGVQLTWLPALPVYLQLGAEVLQGENDLMFGADARSGPHAFTFFAKSSWETTENSTLYFGPSVLFGSARNSNIVPDTMFTGNSALYGMEAVWKWKPSASQEAFTLQGEYLFLNQHGDLNGGDALERRQDGFYLQGIYQLGRWRYGARYDILEPFTDTFRRADVQQDFGARPWRATGSLEFNPSEFTRIRLQYNHDVSGRNGSNNDEVILQFIFGIGAHAAHTF